MKLLIVEDEYYTRKALIKIVKEKYKDVEMILEAENGEEAVNILEGCRFDIIISDIRMPMMNGLELAEYVRDHHPQTIVIIITGYAEFDYAHKALKFRVKDYILKPLQKEEIYKILDACMEEIESKSIKEKHEMMLLKTVEEVVAHQKMNIILQKKGDITEEDVLEMLSLPHGKVCYRVILVRHKKVFVEETREMLSSFLEERSHLKLYFDLTNRNEMMIFSYGEESSKEYEQSIQTKHLYSIYKLLQTEEGEEFVVGVSGIQKEMVRFSTAYQEAQLAMYNYFFQGWGKIYDYETESTHLDQLGAFNELFRIFEHGLKSGDCVLSKQTAQKIWVLIQQNKGKAPQMIQLMASRYEQMINEISKECHLTFEYNLQFNHYNDLQDFQGVFYRLIESMCNSIRLLGSNQSIVQDIVTYMENNYFDNLNLGEMAQNMYFMNASYLSRIFKDETGETFSKTLMRLRMQKAKQLLQETTLNVTEIASMVGFDHVAYFIKAFKRYYDITPGMLKKEDSNK